MSFVSDSNKYVLAPMVDQSELAWRLLARRYGANITFTPMINAGQFVRDKKYREKSMDFSELDRPFVVQFCANNPELFVESAKLVQDHCDGVDLNLGCPQGIARKGHYGSFLQDEWELISSMVRQCVAQVNVPVSVKIRIFPDVNRTIEYANMLEKAGAAFISVHGRTRGQNGQNCGLADWNQIQAVKNAVNVPIIANGGILYFTDIASCLEATGATAVMSAEGQLYNPALFSGKNPVVFEVCSEYLSLVQEYPCSLSIIRGHLFKILRNSLNKHTEFRETLAEAKTVEDVYTFLNELEAKCQVTCMQEPWSNGSEPRVIQFPHWICQPYIRTVADSIENDPHKQLA